MRPIFPQSVLNSHAEGLVPYVRRRVRNEELAALYALLKRDSAQPLRRLSELYNVHHVTLRRWLKDAGKHPVCKGGDSGREEMFQISDVQQIMEEKGMAPKVQEVVNG